MCSCSDMSVCAFHGKFGPNATMADLLEPLTKLDDEELRVALANARDALAIATKLATDTAGDFKRSSEKRELTLKAIRKRSSLMDDRVGAVNAIIEVELDYEATRYRELAKRALSVHVERLETEVGRRSLSKPAARASAKA